MKNIRYAVTVTCLAVVMVTGCQKGENGYTYRDAGIEALNSGDYETAITSFDQAIDASRGIVGKFDVDVLRYRAEAEYRAADYEAAAHTYDILIQVDKETPEYLNMLCTVKAQTGDYAGAIKDYRRSVELDTEKKAPGRMEALLAAGAAMEAQGSSVDAMTLYEEAQAAGIESAALYNRMGLCKFGEKDYEAAIASYEQGLSAADSTLVPELLYNEAVAYEYQGDFKKALELMEQYVSANASDAEAARELAFLKTR